MGLPVVHQHQTHSCEFLSCFRVGNKNIDYIYIYTHKYNEISVINKRIYIYIYIYVYFKMNRSTKRVISFKIYLFIYFIFTYVYVSSLLLLSENIYGTRPCEWGTQWDVNSLVFESWMIFSWLWLYIVVTPFFSFLLVCLPLSIQP